MNRRQFFTATAGAAAASLATPAILSAQSATIVDLAIATPDLSTLVTAVQAAGLLILWRAPATLPSSPPPTVPSNTCRTACWRACCTTFPH